MEAFLDGRVNGLFFVVFVVAIFAALLVDNALAKWERRMRWCDYCMASRPCDCDKNLRP